jgi:hypothetical protein
VNYCHHLASVVCKLFTFQASSPKPLGRLEPNLANIPRFTIAYENMTVFVLFCFFSSSFDRFSRPLQLILVLSYLHGTTNLHVFRPKNQLKRITTHHEHVDVNVLDTSDTFFNVNDVIKDE